MKHRFMVEVETDMTWRDTAEYVGDALSSWGGQYFPGNNEEEADPRFNIGAEDVKVRKLVNPFRGLVRELAGIVEWVGTPKGYSYDEFYPPKLRAQVEKALGGK